MHMKTQETAICAYIPDPFLILAYIYCVLLRYVIISYKLSFPVNLCCVIVKETFLKYKQKRSTDRQTDKKTGKAGTKKKKIVQQVKRMNNNDEDNSKINK